MHFEIETDIEIFGLGYILFQNLNRDMIAAVTQSDVGKYDLSIKRKPQENGFTPKLFICLPIMDVCGLYDEINISVSSFGELKECTFEFNNAIQKDLYLNNEVVYRFPHISDFKLLTK